MASATAITLAGSRRSLFAQNPADPTMRPRPANPRHPRDPTNPTNPASPAKSSSPPIECWWKTDRSAVRVGENFTLTLTCAVLDTERVKVVVDESGLAPSALHLVPFDIVGGERFRDILNAPRRFFQYQYTMRVLGRRVLRQGDHAAEIADQLSRAELAAGRRRAAGTRSAVLAGAGADSRAVARACRRGRYPRHAGRHVRRRRRAAVPVESAADSRGRRVRAGRADGGDAGRARGGEAACDDGDAAADDVAGRRAARGVARARCRAGGEPARRLERRSCRPRGGGAAPCRRGRAVASRQS